MSAPHDPQPIDPRGAADDHAAEPSAILGDDEPAPGPLPKPRGEDGFGLLYRFFFRFQYTLLHIIGPPRLTASMDPRTRLKADYVRRRDLHRQWKASLA